MGSALPTFAQIDMKIDNCKHTDQVCNSETGAVEMLHTQRASRMAGEGC